MHDVIVVGAGPAGCHAAALLASHGFDVHVLEEHEEIGEPVDCSGVIGADSFDFLRLPDSLKLGEVNVLNLVSPSQLAVRFLPSSPLAYVIDRAGLDRAIARDAAEAGAEFHLGARVVDLELRDDCVRLEVVRQTSTDSSRVQNSKSEVQCPRSEVQCSKLNVQRGEGSTNGQLPITNYGSLGGGELPVTSYDLRVANYRPSGNAIDELPSTNNPPRSSVRARVVILAGGPRYRLQEKLGMGRPRAFLRTGQVELPAHGIDETRVLLGSGTAPGSFAWMVPFRRNGERFARIGVSAKEGPLPYLNKLLQKLVADGHVAFSGGPIRSWVIPVAPLRRTSSDRVLAVGDAAGQTKPTTGGGIYYGLLCAEAAAKTVIAAFDKGRFDAATLSSYETEWRKNLGNELRIGAAFRRLCERLDDEEIDEIFRLVQSDGILASVGQRARFDWHKDVILFALRHPQMGKIFLRGLFR